MPRTYRLTGEEIRHLSRLTGGQAGERFHGAFFSLLVAPTTAKHPKFAVVVSKKVAAHAVDRNKIKRRARAIVSKSISGIQKPAALVLYAKRETKSAEFAQLERDVRSLLARV